MRKSMTTILVFSLLVLGGLSLSACNTVKGAGQDVEHAGESMQDAAD